MEVDSPTPPATSSTTSGPIRKWLNFLGKGFESLETLEKFYKDGFGDDDNGYSELTSGSRHETIDCQDNREITKIRNGRKEGLFVVFDSRGSLQQVGKYRAGEPHGPCWRRLEGDSWVVSNNNHTNIFLYPDLNTVLVGSFDVLGMAEGEVEVCQVVEVGTKSGVLTPVLRSLGSHIPGPLLDPSATLLRQPYVRDPYENKHVEVRESLIPGAGEGLFAKRRLEAGQLIAYFAGVQLSGEGCVERSEYSISLRNGKVLDIPKDLRSTYCGTLGHKACHSFQPSAAYRYAVHPRFGLVRCLSALHNIQEGEEITTDYRYNLSRAPEWYKSSLIHFIVGSRGLSLESAAAKIHQLVKLGQAEEKVISEANTSIAMSKE